MVAKVRVHAPEEPTGPHYGLRLDMPPPEHIGDGSLSLGERLKGIEDDQREVLRVVHEIEIKGSLAAQQALSRVTEVAVALKLLDDRVDKLEITSASSSEVNAALKGYRGWLLSFAGVMIALAGVIIALLVSLHTKP